jgi:hypothetical protein
MEFPDDLVPLVFGTRALFLCKRYSTLFPDYSGKFKKYKITRDMHGFVSINPAPRYKFSSYAPGTHVITYGDMVCDGASGSIRYVGHLIYNDSAYVFEIYPGRYFSRYEAIVNMVAVVKISRGTRGRIELFIRRFCAFSNIRTELLVITRPFTSLADAFTRSKRARLCVRLWDRDERKRTEWCARSVEKLREIAPPRYFDYASLDSTFLTQFSALAYKTYFDNDRAMLGVSPR